MSIPDAVVADLREHAVPGRQVWDAQVLPDSADADYDSIDRDGYVVVYCPEGDTVRPTAGNLPGQYVGKSVLVRTHSFGPTRRAAAWLSLRVADRLCTYGVDAPGWGHGSVRDEDGHINHSPVVDNDVPEFPVVLIQDEFYLLFAKST